jgi:DNA helicase HerA-like ATPase
MRNLTTAGGGRIARAPKELLAEALDLPEEVRAQLARSLIASLDEAEEEDPGEIERAWLAEVSRRAAEIDAGAVTTRPAVEVFRAAQEELRAIRASRVSGG